MNGLVEVVDEEKKFRRRKCVGALCAELVCCG